MKTQKPVCVVHMLYCGFRTLGPPTVLCVSRVAAIMLWCQSWCHEYRILVERESERCSTLRLYQRTVALLLTEVSQRHTKYSNKTVGGSRSQPPNPWRGNQCLVSSKTSKATSAWTLQITTETLVCRWMTGQTYSSKDCVWTLCLIDSIRTQEAHATRCQHFPVTQSNNQDHELTSVCFVCCAVVNTSSAHFYTAVEDCSSSSKTREKGYCSVDSSQTMLHW